MYLLNWIRKLNVAEQIFLKLEFIFIRYFKLFKNTFCLGKIINKCSQKMNKLFWILVNVAKTFFDCNFLIFISYGYRFWSLGCHLWWLFFNLHLCLFGCHFDDDEIDDDQFCAVISWLSFFDCQLLVIIFGGYFWFLFFVCHFSVAMFWWINDNQKCI